MNRFIIASLLFLGTVSSVVSDSFAQEFAQPYKRWEFGVFATGGLSVFFGTVPDGSKTDIHVAWTAGGLFAYTFKPDFGVAMGLGIENRGMYFHEQSKDEPNETIDLTYLSIQPSLKFKSFLLGVNIGIPMSVTQTITGTTTQTDPFIVPASKITSSDQNTIVDIRIAGLLPLVENDAANLDFIIQASYCLSDAIGGNGFYTTSQNRQNSPNPVTKSPLPTVQIGLAYLFSPMGKQ